MNDGAHWVRQFEDIMARFQQMSHIHSQVKKFGLTTSEMFILRYLDACDRAKASDLARVVGLSPGAVTQVCDELVKAGFVDRTRSEEDRRVVLIAITDKGRQKLEDIRAARIQKWRSVMERLGPEDAAELLRILQRVLHLVDEASKEHGCHEQRPPADGVQSSQ
ncbi:MAG: MarR family transcriptional regulator [Alicyclobacillus macrosporangiidus]|uniref:MarR family winged helix-turn-helix transcriptional regulator n=1 Tax=Alicyclobacillus TaxID=29330 RepID=UPI00041FA939|nr:MULTISPECIES: MarR family transcriptional regulator [Alicyclobacillus]MCL6597865.1 MarR family transcriptional regulator [Alicyclobacillus macrosporangiidus]